MSLDFLDLGLSELVTCRSSIKANFKVANERDKKTSWVLHVLKKKIQNALFNLVIAINPKIERADIPKEVFTLHQGITSSNDFRSLAGDINVNFEIKNNSITILHDNQEEAIRLGLWLKSFGKIICTAMKQYD